MEFLLIGLGVAVTGVLVCLAWVRLGKSETSAAGAVQDSFSIPDEPEIRNRNRESATYRVHHGRSASAMAWDPYAADQSRSSRARAARHRAKTQPPRPAVPDYYAILGLTADASTFEIERAYRRHAAIIHPDRFFDNPRLRLQAEAKLRQLNEAASTLRDPERRMKYDTEWGVR